MRLAAPGAKVEAGYREWFRRRMIASPLVIGGKAEYSACRMLDNLALAPGDVLTVTRLDRLARSTFDLLGAVKRIVDANAQIRSLAEPWADSTSSTGRLMLAVLSGLANVERDLNRTRTAEGRTRAPRATLQELADSYDRSISTMRRATRAA